jgi:hypothetical protein
MYMPFGCTKNYTAQSPTKFQPCEKSTDYGLATSVLW